MSAKKKKSTSTTKKKVGRPKSRKTTSKKVSQPKKSITSQTKGRSKSNIEKDASRASKKPGWRMKGNSKKKPTRADIKAGRAYYEARPNRSDINSKGVIKL